MPGISIYENALSLFQPQLNPFSNGPDSNSCKHIRCGDSHVVCYMCEETDPEYICERDYSKTNKQKSLIPGLNRRGY